MTVFIPEIFWQKYNLGKKTEIQKIRRAFLITFHAGNRKKDNFFRRVILMKKSFLT